MIDTIEPGDHVRIGDGDVDWVVVRINGPVPGTATLRSGLTDRFNFDVPLSRLWVRVKA